MNLIVNIVFSAIVSATVSMLFMSRLLKKLEQYIDIFFDKEEKYIKKFTIETAAEFRQAIMEIEKGNNQDQDKE